MTDIILYNARLITMDEGQTGTAVALSGGKITYVGDDAGAKALAGADTRLIDAAGRTVMPGLNESHIHLFAGSTELSQLSLFEQHGFENVKARVQAYAAENPGQPIVQCNAVDYTVFGEGVTITRHMLDEILPDRPLSMMSPDHHTVWANTAALKGAGLFDGADLPPGNEIVMGEDGHALGELRETAAFGPIFDLTSNGGRDRLGMDTGRDPLVAPTEHEFAADLETLEKGLKHLAAFGITSFQNMDGNRYTLDLLAALETEGRLICRGRVPGRFISGDVEDAISYAVDLKRDFSSDTLSAGTIKFFIDGVLDSHTAVMSAPYEDRPDWRGESRFAPDFFADLCTRADAEELQIAVHSIGDGATQITLDAYATARAVNGARDSRHRIEHLEVVREEDFDRIRDLAVVPSMQPPHPPGQCGLPMEPTVSRIGTKNWPRAYAWRRIRDLGLPLILSSDWPVSSVDPWASLHSALTRQPWHESQPDNRLSLHEALEGYTTFAAYAEFKEDRKGRLAPGYLADVILLDRDLAASEPETVKDTRCLLTICGGKVTHDAL